MFEDEINVTKVPKKKRKRGGFEIFPTGIDCSGGLYEELEVIYSLRCNGITLHNLRETLHFDGTWPEVPVEASKYPFGHEYPDSADDREPVKVEFTDIKYEMVREHLNVWMIRLYARLQRVFHPECEDTAALTEYAKAVAETFGYSIKSTDRE